MSLVVPVGPAVIVVSGGVVSTVKVRVAGVASVLPAGSVARTSKVCEPSSRAASCTARCRARTSRRRPGTRTSSRPRWSRTRTSACCRWSAARPRGDRGVGRGRVDGEGRAGRRGVDVAGDVDRPHLEGVRAVASGAWCTARFSRRARPRRSALERRACLGRRERERRRGVAGRPVGARVIVVSGGVSCRSCRCCTPPRRRLEVLRWSTRAAESRMRSPWSNAG